jgi:hypothetical protein
MKEMYSHEMPAWMRLLGAWRINRDSIDFNWGYFAPRFGLELLIHRGFYFDSTYRISFCFGWGHFHIKLPFKTALEEYCDWPSYGFAVHNSSLWIRTGDHERNQQTRRMISWDFPFATLIHDRHEVQQPSGEWVKYSPEYNQDAIPDGRHVESHPYTYKLKDGEVQERTATVYKERRIYHRKWLPFWTKVFTAISVEFSDEVGERSGSWKGGCTGCGYNILPNESMLECLRRMEKERVFN